MITKDTITVTTALILCSWLPLAESISSRIFRIYAGPLVNARMDPLVKPGTCSGHVHSVFGSAAFRNEIDITDVVDVDWQSDEGKNEQTTSNVISNLSMYWAPSMYIYNPNDDKFYHVRNFARIYYRSKHQEDDWDETKPIPTYLQLIIGDANRKTPYGEGEAHDHVYWNIRTDRETSRNTDWLYMKELDLSEVPQIEMNVEFPNCLKQNLQTTSNDFRSHAAYSSAVGECPQSHPVRIPIVRLEVRFELDHMRTILGSEVVNNVDNWVLSTGDKTGAGAHADFVSGWPEELWTDILDQCQEDQEGPKCPPIAKYYTNHTRVMEHRSVPFTNPVPNEAVDVVSSLPSGDCPEFVSPDLVPRTLRDDILPDIRGPFVASVSARFDNPEAGSWQRIFDMGNGPNLNNVIFTQEADTRNMMLHVINEDNQNSRLSAPDAIVKGETANWRCGVDHDGLMWIEKNGVRLVEQYGLIPSYVSRYNKYIGTSNWGDHHPLQGSVSDLHISSGYPEIQGAFVMSTEAKFDDLYSGAWQRIFDFGNGANQNNVILTQANRGNDMRMYVINQSNTVHHVTAIDAIVPGEFAKWRCGVDYNGLAWIEKNGVVLESRMITEFPDNVVRKNKFIGKSHWSHNTDHIGVITGFQLTSGLPEIKGPFIASARVRFDDPSGGRWQRVFDYTNENGRDAIIFSQRASSRDMLLQVFRSNTLYSEVMAFKAITRGETAMWRCGVSNDGMMWIEKNGIRLAERKGLIPENIVRVHKNVAATNMGPDDFRTPLEGLVSGLEIINTA